MKKSKSIIEKSTPCVLNIPELELEVESGKKQGKAVGDIDR